MKMQDALSSFLARCVALNLAGGSVVWYRQILRTMAGFLASRGVHELGAVTPACSWKAIWSRWTPFMAMFTPARWLSSSRRPGVGTK